MCAWKLTEKFISYVDILGYSALTKAAEAGNGVTCEDMEAILRLLGTEDDRRHYQKYGPATCPQAPCLRKDLDFQLTQVWDCVVVSTEVSPAGIVNLVSHCFDACINLLAKGIMCRGYIQKGMIFHDGPVVRGSGHVDTVSKEKAVSFFSKGAGDKGTPFIEIDPEVVEYVASQPDKCVKEMFSRMVLSHEGLTAIFPMKLLRHTWIMTGWQRFDAKEEKRQNNLMREGIKGLKDKIVQFASSGDASAIRKSEHYLRALDEQLKACDRADEMIDQLVRPFPAHRMTKDKFPGLYK
jgi:hypothetical protein